MTAAETVGQKESLYRYKPSYLEQSCQQGSFEDVVLVSEEGDHYPINACVLASLCPAAFRIIRDAHDGDSDDPTLVLTNLSR